MENHDIESLKLAIEALKFITPITGFILLGLISLLYYIGRNAIGRQVEDREAIKNLEKEVALLKQQDETHAKEFAEIKSLTISSMENGKCLRRKWKTG